MQLKSTEDPSVNFIEEALAGFLEARYVRRSDDYFICYLSSQSGCNKGCKFCFLTTTKQTKFENVLPIDYLVQASKVLKHYCQDPGPRAKYVTFSFMARGEALANPYIITGSDEILYELGKLATALDPDLSVRFSISTIMPKLLDKPLEQIFKVIHPTLYYSLYSTNPEFRKKWLPQAMPLDDALSALRDYQIFTKKIIKIHHCFIKGENDSEQDVYSMIEYIKKHNLDAEFNLVRYNPFSDVQGSESSEEVINRNMEIISSELHGKAKIVTRVGRDVFASCGTFFK